MALCVPNLLEYIFTYLFWGVFRVLHEHIQRLSKVVTANHRALQIPEVRMPVSTRVVGTESCSGYHVRVPSFPRKQNIIKYVTLFALEVLQST